jgi:hypothetical protein
LIGFKSNDELRALARAEHEALLEEHDSVDLGENWIDKAYATAKEQVLSGALVDDDPVFTVVAHGEVKDARCGTFKRRKVKKLRGCLRVHKHNEIGVTLDGRDVRNKVSVRRAFYSCHRAECPSCAIGSWATREAYRAEAVLRYASVNMRFGEIFHIILSFPKDADMSFEDKRKYLAEYMLSVGIVGGCYIYHHFRYHHADETFVGETARFVRDNCHFHVLGFIKGGYGNCHTCRCQKERTFDRCGACNGFEGVVRRAYDKAVGEGRVPLIIKVKDKRITVGGTLWYELSHASLRKGVKKQSVVNWFGVCGRRKLMIPKGALPQRKENLCEICHEPEYDIQFLGSRKNYAGMLAFMSGFKDSQSFLYDYYGADGKPQWAVALKQGVKDYG